MALNTDGVYIFRAFMSNRPHNDHRDRQAAGTKSVTNISFFVTNYPSEIYASGMQWPPTPVSHTFPAREKRPPPLKIYCCYFGCAADARSLIDR